MFMKLYGGTIVVYGGTIVVSSSGRPRITDLSKIITRGNFVGMGHLPSVNYHSSFAANPAVIRVYKLPNY